MTQYCPHCSGPNADFAKYCTHCGKPLLAPEEKKNQTLLVVLICLVIGLVIVFVGLLAIVLIKDNSSSGEPLLQDSICLDSTAVEPDDAAEEIPTVAAAAEDTPSTTASVDLDKLVRKASRSMEGESGEDVFFRSLSLEGDYVVCTYDAFCNYWNDKDDWKNKDHLLVYVTDDLADYETCCEMARCAYHNGYKLKIVVELPDDRLSYTYDIRDWFLMPM